MWLLVAVLVVSVGLDQWSKIWADASLGTIQHPVPYTMTPSDAGRTLGDVIRERAGLSDEEMARLATSGARGLTQLKPELKPAPKDKAFRSHRGKARPTFYWAFHHETLDMPPRRIPLAQNARADLEKYGNKSIQEYLPIALPYLNDAARARILDAHLFSAVHVPLNLEAPVQAGSTYLLMRRTVTVIPNFMQFKYAENPGAAWGFMADQSESFRKWFFLLVSIVALFVIGGLYYRLEEEHVVAAWAFAVILSGAVGNFIDRIRFNYVIDFIDMYVGDSHWPTYNVADIAITVGVALLLLELLFKKNAAFLGSNTQENSAA
jgi:signal peptidase II